MSTSLRTLAIALAATSLNGRVGAQQAEPAASTEQPVAQDAAQPMADIVVTAQRRESSVQKTPLAITALSQASLIERGVRNTVDLAASVPSLQVNVSGQVFLRGIGTANINEISDPTVATNLDGIYLARPRAVTATGFYDLSRVKVLRGPQGTLYGRNATSGSINIVSARPEFNDSGAIAVEGGNYGTFLTSGHVNLAASDTLALRASFQTVRNDGYLDSTSKEHPRGDSLDVKSGRLQALYKPSDRLTVILRGDYTWDDSLYQPYGAVTRTAGVKTIRSQDYGHYAAANASHYAGISGEVNWKVGPGTLTYLGACRQAFQNQNTEYRPFDGRQYAKSNDKTVQQELRYAGEIGPVSFVSGLFYFHKDNDVDARFQAGDVYYTLFQNPVKAESYAAFGQATWRIVDGLRLTGGLRYTHDNKSRVGVGLLRTPDFVTTAQFAANQASGSWSRVNWKAGIEYDLAPRVLFYANASTGYKAGGYFDRSGPNNTYGPETIRAYEAGVKSRMLDNRLTVNLDGLYYDYNDLQVSTYADVTGSGVLSQVTLNAGKARSWGVEAETSFAVTPSDRLDATVGYFNAKYTSFRLAGGRSVLRPRHARRLYGQRSRQGAALDAGRRVRA